MVFNKIDAFTFVPKDEDDLTPRTRENIDLDELKRTWMNKMQDNCIFISAKEPDEYRCAQSLAVRAGETDSYYPFPL